MRCGEKGACETGRGCRCRDDDGGRRRSKQRLWHAAHAGLVAMEVALEGVAHGAIGFLGVSRRTRSKWPIWQCGQTGGSADRGLVRAS